jgi:hypothetical protein
MQHITLTELDAQAVELLPSKETLFFDTNWAGVAASNASYAVNAATLLSSATSSATQLVGVIQG